MMNLDVTKTHKFVNLEQKNTWLKYMMTYV